MTTEHCCEPMRAQVDQRCPDHPDSYDCGDALLVHVSNYREYGLIIHDGGRSYIRIAHCPWCGASLPESVRERWFDAVEALGIDPWNDDVPAEFEDERWLAGQTGLDAG